MNGDYSRCATCTVLLVERAYRAAPWFRLVRGPLLAAMRLLALAHGIRARSVAPRSAECARCPRFLKNMLKDRSPLFNRLHGAVNPLFDALVLRILGEEEVRAAKALARERTDKGGNDSA